MIQLSIKRFSVSLTVLELSSIFSCARRPLQEMVSAVMNERSSVPLSFTLEQNYPNPFNPTTTIQYALPHHAHVTLSVFNTLGQQVASLVNGGVDAGHHSVQFDASGLASGVYFYRLQAGSSVDTKRLLLLR